MLLPPAGAALLGYAAGLVFFAANFAWFGETAGALLGPFGPLLDIGPAAIEAVAFALAGALTAFGTQRLAAPWVPPVAAAGFTLAEALRSTGLLGAPLYQVGAAFVATPLAPLAAVGGVYAVTFTVALAGAALAAAVVRPGPAGTPRLLFTAGLIAASTALAWLAWPARQVGPATLRVAAVQGDIRQSVKWEPRSLATAVDRYSRLTASLRAERPAFTLWPETVITTDLRLAPDLAALPANAELAGLDRRLQTRFTALAQSLGGVLAVGSTEATASHPYNDVFFFTPHGIEGVYRKRQLVPFAEFLPGAAWLRAVPFAALVSDFGAGRDPGPFDPRLRVAPLICWEAGFGDLAAEQAARGARFFAIATDDAWFGASDGPYAQAQLAQLRAIETGRWVLRAGATGISGIVAPDGSWRARLGLGAEGVVSGALGEPQPTLYARVGPLPVGAALVILLAAAFTTGRRRRTAP